ncbi:SAM-dependent methyltransferase [Azonexus sp. IMCC34839]|uniref:SAM-dependent methyltransferase n=1 Tax=Azonexus sp. IMCC34839 TaxID=3133695 RepID=UPI00399A5D36
MTQFDHEAFWSARYRDAGEDYLFGTAPNRFLAEQEALFQPGMQVLSVADGEGRNSVWLAELGCSVTATEISAVALAKAQKLAHGRHVSVDFVQADLLSWNWPQTTYDAIVGIFIQFVGPKERDSLFAAMKQALKPGGVLLLQGYTPKQLEYRTGGPSAVENLYTGELLRQAFDTWEIVLLKEHEAEISEGRAHVGRSALIDLVVRKPTGR